MGCGCAERRRKMAAALKKILPTKPVEGPRGYVEGTRKTDTDEGRDTDPTRREGGRTRNS